MGDPSQLEQQIAPRLFKVGHRIYRIPLPTDFPVGDINAYLIDGPEPVLVDTGVAGERTLAALEDALAYLSRRIEDLAAVLITHVHVDHAGCAKAIRDRSGAAVYLHPRGHGRLADPQGSHEERQPWFRELLARAGFSPPTAERYLATGELFLRYTEPCPELCAARAGDTLHFAGRRIEVHESFGHVCHHLSFALPEEDGGLLLSGDHILPHITPNPTLEPPAPGERKPKPLCAYRESLQRIGRLPIRLVCPGHDRPFTGLLQRCEELLRHQRTRCRHVLGMLAEHGPLTRKELSLALFGKVPLWEVFLTMSEVEAALELLAEQGALRLRRQGEVDLIELTAELSEVS